MNYFSPFEQFKFVEIFKINYNFIFSNGLFQLLNWIIIFSIFSIILLYSKKKKFEFNFFLKGFELMYVFIYNIIQAYIGKHVNIYFPFFFYLFLFILMNNLLGLLPYSFTMTSHFVVTFGLSFMVWYSILLLGVENWGLQFFALFYPKGISVQLAFFLSMIELLSYSFRVFSLALRLLANMIAGHILLDCLAFYIYKVLFFAFVQNSISFISIIYSIIPIIFLIVLFLFELFVAFLQSYIFIVLSCIYLKEIL